MSIVKNNLIKTVKLPYKNVRGSFEYRQQKAGQYTHKVMQTLLPDFAGEGVSLSKFGRDLKKVLPDNLKVFVKKNKDAYSNAQLNRVFTKDNYVVAQSLEIIPDKNGKIHEFDIPTVAHEIRHLADSLFHPKILAREQLLTKKGLDTDKFYNFYDNEIYVGEIDGGKNLKKLILKDIRHKTEKVLKGYSSEDKINMLQYMRYSLMSENNAYKDEYKIAKKLHKKNYPVYEDVLFDQTKEYMFNEKIKLFKDMALDIIREERGKHRARIKSQHK